MTARRRWSRSAWSTVLVLLVAVVAVARFGDGDASGDGDQAAPPGTTASTSRAGPAATTHPSGSDASTTIGSTGTSTPPEAAAEVDRLVVAEPPADLPRYERAAFGDDWAYDPATGCNTRELVLIDEAIVAPTVDDRCRSTNGRWRSAYDGVAVTDVADLQIDHLVPLADAWRSGAASWSPDQRAAFHDDQTHPETLIAVTGHTNQSKGDSSPDQWLPPDRTSWCTYATDWVAVKTTWHLSVTPAEKATLVSILAGC